MAKEEATLLLRIKEVGSEALDKTKSALASVGKIAVAAFGAASAAIAAAVHSYKESEQATNSLNQALVTQGIYTRDLSRAYQQMASSLEKTTTFADEQIVAAQAVMQGYLGQTKISKELMQATLDLAAAKKIDLASAAELVGKTIGTSTNALARQGIQIDANASKTEKLAAVTKQLNGHFGGQAQAAAQGLGSLEQMKNAVDNVLEAVGERFAPILVMAAQSITKLAADITNSVPLMDAITAAMDAFAKSVAIGKAVMEGFGAAIGGILGTVSQTITFAIEGRWREAWESAKGITTAGTDAVRNSYQNLNADLKAIDDARVTSTEQRLAHEEEMEKQAAANKEARANEQKALDDAFWATKSEEELAREAVHNDALVQQQVDKYNRMIAAANTFEQQQDIQRQKRKFLEDQEAAEHRKRQDALAQYDAMMSKVRTEAMMTMLNSMAAMQNSKHKEMVTIGKAAAIAMVGMDTARGAVAAWAALAGIPIVGPALGAAAAAAIIAYGAEQIGNISGVSLAEGGIVKATPGGVPATIGEGRYDEAVVPLDGSSGIGGNTINLTVNGGLLGDRNEAREFAIAIDKELLELRRSGAALSYDDRNIA